MVNHNSGKTRTAGAEVAIHATGRYPAWWTGRRFNKPISAWIGAETNQSSRDVTQEAMLGKLNSWGTGWLPEGSFDTKQISVRQCGISDVVDTVMVKHISGGESDVTFKSYQQGDDAWQGKQLDVVWLDEEPGMKLFSEANIRRVARNGILFMTRTPLYGMSDVIQHFLNGGQGVTVVTATWDDALHLDSRAKEQLLASIPEYERETRTQGVPMMGHGAVFPIADSDITCDPFQLPPSFRYLCAIDFGFDHPAAAVWGAYDADTDVWYIYDSYKADKQAAPYHAQQIKSRGDWINVAWPHDGLQKDKGSGKPLADQYRLLGVRMLGLSARYDDKTGSSQAIEPAVLEIWERMRTGRLKIFRNQTDLLAEKRLYHREDGQIVAKNDDILSALRYLTMMRRYASPLSRIAMPDRAESYDPLAAFSS